MLVEALPRRLQQVVVLHYFADMTVDSVARALGVAPGTVKRDLFDARAKLAAAAGGCVNERELDELLRSRPEPLPAAVRPLGNGTPPRPAAPSREAVRCPARRDVVVLAGVGLGPRVLFADHRPSEQRVSIAASPSTALRADRRPARAASRADPDGATTATPPDGRLRRVAATRSAASPPRRCRS